MHYSIDAFYKFFVPAYWGGDQTNVIMVGLEFDFYNKNKSLKLKYQNTSGGMFTLYDLDLKPDDGTPIVPEEFRFILKEEYQDRFFAESPHNQDGKTNKVDDDLPF